MTRCYDWQTKLREFIESRTFVPFNFGTNDCCLFACDAILAITGEDVAHGLRIYTNELEAEHVLAQYGGVAGVADMVTARYGIEEIDPKFAQRGDVVLCHLVTGDTLAIMDTSCNPVGPGKDKIERIPRKLMRKAWRVG